MKPVAFDYQRPRDVESAVALAGGNDMSVKFLAGGQSLGPMLNLRLVQPEVLVDVTAIPELKHIEESADGLDVGACITHADIEDGRVPDAMGGALREVAHCIAYRAVRTRGTIGGSLAHADPAADWVVVLAALGASIIVRGPQGVRTVGAAEFMTGVFETVLAPDELVISVHIPRLSSAARWGYYKACRKVGEFAHACGAVLHDPDRSVFRAVIGAVDAPPIVFADATELFGGHAGADLAASLVPQKARQAIAAAGVRDPIDRQMHVAALRRAAARASSR